MKKQWKIRTLIPIYILTLFLIILLTVYADQTINTIANENIEETKRTVIIDAGHGGEDGGATSCSGVLECSINLDIAIKLNDLFRILGYKTRMIRTENISIYTSGNTIAEKKVSDLKERVRITNNTANAFLISIHQNYFPDAQYRGAQVFYGKNENGKLMAEHLQNSMVQLLNPGSNRKSKHATGVYLMEQVNCPALLIECGFLSNPSEEALLRDNAYQKKLCCIIVSCCSRYWNEIESMA